MAFRESKSQEIADSLNCNLPVKVLSEDVSLHPEFTKLLLSLRQYIGDNGVNNDRMKDVNKTKERFKLAKLKWLQISFIYSELTDMLTNCELKTVNSTNSSGSTFYKMARECLRFSEAVDYIDFDPDPATDTTLLGLSKEDLITKNPLHKHLPSIQQKLIPEFESHLRKRCEDLAELHELFLVSKTTQTLPTDDSMKYANVSQLTANVELALLKLEQAKQELKKERDYHEKQTTQYENSLQESLNCLEILITKYRLRAQAESDRLTSETLAARCEALCLKIKILRLQLLCDTYNAATVNALGQIRTKLDSAVRGAEKELMQSSQVLATYEAVGSQFDDLIQEYTSIKEDVDNKRWAFRQLKISQDK